jgi:DNA-binding MarR family transcriptional regulator
MQIKKIELTDEERKVLRTLARSGAMSPSKVSAETLILPGKTLNLLKNMADVGLVFLRDDPASADGRVVVLTARGRELLRIVRLWDAGISFYSEQHVSVDGNKECHILKR